MTCDRYNASSGAGGQHVNTTIQPFGYPLQQGWCHVSEKSLAPNREIAMQVLKALFI